MSEFVLSASSLYPERAVVPESAADRWVRVAYGRMWHRLRSPIGELTHIARSAGLLEAEIRAMDDTSLRLALGEVARRIWRGRGALVHALAIAREAARRSLGTRPYDVQIAGAACLIDGCLAEMQTGEGKTLTAAVAATVVAMGGAPVHVVTVNDYLAQRDAEELTPLFEFLGLSVGSVVSGMDWSARSSAYGCNITYCTGKELVFDYLKDSVASGGDASGAHLAVRSVCGAPTAQRTLLRGMHFALVDEADSVFIDEARTPLILAEKAGPHDRPERFSEALSLARSMQDGFHFAMAPARRSVELSAAGRASLSEQVKHMAPSWGVRAEREHMVLQALRALHLFQRDHHYIVRDDKVQIVDEQTGRVLDGRNWEQGLHQLIESKEGCPFSEDTRTTARITYQRFFRKYLRLAGMTGTARDASAELWSVYGLQTVRIPTHRPVRRTTHASRCAATQSEKWAMVAKRTIDLVSSGRPVLIGTRSVAASENLSVILREHGIVHRVLNARQDSDEAELVRLAGQPGVVTIATNMAGRGTDIKPTEEVRAIGGLHVILTEFHESPRIDRQLFGRTARQGDPGSSEAMIALDDEIIRLHAGPSRVLLSACTWGPLTAWLITLVRWVSQHNAERHNRNLRRNASAHDDQLARSLGFSGRG